MKRILAGSLLSITLLGAGTTYASLNSDVALSNWYNHSFLVSSSSLENEVANEVNLFSKGILNDVTKATSNVENQIREYKRKITADSEKEIKEHSNQYIQQLQATKEILKEQNEKGMRVFAEQVKEREAAQINQDAEAILLDLLDEQSQLK